MNKRTLLITAAIGLALTVGFAANSKGLFADHDHDAGTVLDHSGGTDANGCHTNHTTGDYHCHRPK